MRLVTNRDSIAKYDNDARSPMEDPTSNPPAPDEPTPAPSPATPPQTPPADVPTAHPDAEAVVTAQPADLPAPVIRKSMDERKQLLARTIQTQVAGGARIESQSDYQAVLVRGHRPNHTLHLILTLITVGLWGLVWIGIAVFGGEKRQMAQVDEFGNVTVQQL